jgi:hypothetical protein
MVGDYGSLGINGSLRMVNGELLIKNYELWFFRSAKILDEEKIFLFNLLFLF